MAKATKQPSVIDGFSSVQAVRRSGRKSDDARTRPSRTRLPVVENGPVPDKPADARPRARIGQTAIPQKHDILCYECSYAFTLSGKIGKTICPKCHKSLNVGDHKVAGKTALTVRTIGSVEIAPEGELAPGSSIVARNVVIAGNVKGARIECTGRIELCNGADLDIRKITVKDIVVRPDCTCKVSHKFECRNLEVIGDLEALVYVTGTATVRPGGTLRGDVRTPHLIVEEGGGLNASVSAGPFENSDVDDKKRPAKGGR